MGWFELMDGWMHRCMDGCMDGPLMSVIYQSCLDHRWFSLHTPTNTQFIYFLSHKSSAYTCTHSL